MICVVLFMTCSLHSRTCGCNTAIVTISLSAALPSLNPVGTDHRVRRRSLLSSRDFCLPECPPDYPWLAVVLQGEQDWKSVEEVYEEDDFVLEVFPTYDEDFSGPPTGRVCAKQCFYTDRNSPRTRADQQEREQEEETNAPMPAEAPMVVVAPGELIFTFFFCYFFFVKADKLV